MAKTPNGLLAFLALLSILSFQSVSAQERLRIAWSGSSPAHTPIWVVEEKNLLKKYGIDGEIISITASSIAVQVLLAGEVDVIIGSVANLTSRLAGADTVMILGLVPTFVDHLITHPSITKIEQLKGKVGAVNRAGTSSELGIKLTLRKLGLDPDKEVKLVPRGGNPERLAAISQGIAQFTHMDQIRAWAIQDYQFRAAVPRIAMLRYLACTDPEIAQKLWGVVEEETRGMAVLSYQEIDDDVALQPVGWITNPTAH